MVLQDKFKSFFHTFFHRKRNENAEPADQSQSQSQNPNESQPCRPDEEQERNEHYEDTYGALSEVAAPKPVDPGPPHRPSLEERLESQGHPAH